jgi:transcriptional regulator with XRE-family HTH domain
MPEDTGVHPIKAALKRQWPPMSQARLARELGMNQTVLNRWLNGLGEPPDGFYTAAAAILGCSPDDLKPAEPEAVA